MDEKLEELSNEDLLKLYSTVNSFIDFLEKEKKNIEKMREPNE